MFNVLFETWSQGGLVLVPIFLAGFWGFFLVLKTYAALGSGLWNTGLIARFEALRAAAASGREDEVETLASGFPPLVRQGVDLALAHRNLPEPALRDLLEEKLAYRLFELERRIPLIKSLAAAAPLLGLMGTVSGLIHTFQAMTEYGGGDSQLLSTGISEALLSTQTGLLVAIALVLLGQRLEGRVTWLKSQTEYGVTQLLNLFQSGRTARS